MWHLQNKPLDRLFVLGFLLIATHLHGIDLARSSSLDLLYKSVRPCRGLCFVCPYYRRQTKEKTKKTESWHSFLPLLFYGLERERLVLFVIEQGYSVPYFDKDAALYVALFVYLADICLIYIVVYFHSLGVSIMQFTDGLRD